MTRFDIIICGAGCAGLSLAYHLSKSNWVGKKILILDKDAKAQNDRTWCFWSEKTPIYTSARAVSWEKLCFIGKDFEKIVTIAPYKYYQIKGLDFYEEIKQHLASLPHFVFKQESVRQITADNDTAIVQTDEGIYEGQWIFNSIPAFNPSFKCNENTIRQYFKGFFIKTSVPVFVDDTVKLMDFSMSKNEDAPIEFFYVLPYNPFEALVECTVFAPQHTKQNPENYREAIQNYLFQKFGDVVFEIQAEEIGVIPMSEQKVSFKTAPCLFHIGTAGGMTKATTGYTFEYIQRFCADFLRKWARFDEPPDHYQTSKKRFRFYDRLLLHIIRHHPTSFQPIMETLFKKNDFKLILKFLDEDTNWLEDAQIFASLNWNPFLKAIYEQYFFKTSATPQQTHRHRAIVDSVPHH